MDDRMSCDEIHSRHHRLQGRAEGALGRLLDVRARLVRASSSVINEPFRNELLRLIDEGH
jgi:hypothetical protein